MELRKLTEMFLGAGTRKADLDSLLRYKASEACGLAGSSAAVLISAIKGRKVPVLVTGDDADDDLLHGGKVLGGGGVFHALLPQQLNAFACFFQIDGRKLRISIHHNRVPFPSQNSIEPP